MTNANIISAAFMVWGRALYKKTSLSQVAAELGVTKTALYRHFRSKRDLVEGMMGYFCDDFARSIRSGYEEAQGTAGAAGRCRIMARTIGEYFCREPEKFVFFLVRIHGNGDLAEQLRSRGIDISRLEAEGGEGRIDPVLFRRILETVCFWVAHFHRLRWVRGQLPESAEIEAELDRQERLIMGGLGLRPAAPDFAVLEERCAAVLPGISEHDGLLQAVAEAVAEAGPWNASMDMVARRSGLSKSGLYAHFRSRQDMLARLFITEMEQLLAYTELCRGFSSIPEEQVYLVIAAIAGYLRSRPQIMTALDWVRVRNLDLGIKQEPQLRRLLAGIAFENTGMAVQDDPRMESVAQWILFLVVNTTVQLFRFDPPGGGLSPESFRKMYRFVASGLEGCNF
ncbi:MAG: TetR/AcrR family transcriptional regulator; helix-turn-helix transcriptional regulator [Spirochaetaceae bacterium]|jgi:AcrR family transcriptional regulator|nr:TetR/AcrR family transcriptional regulator; helix-turn-helix transcriptional regulator [Spirochaetaceae bacterium]